MNARMTLGAIASVLAMLLAAGCDSKDKQIRFLNNDKRLLMQQNDQLQKELQAANEQLANAANDLTAREQDMVSLKQQITALEDRIGQAPPPPPPPGKPTWVVAGDVLFAPGQATINARRIAALDHIAAALKGKSLPIYIIGHTDSDPIVRTAKLWRDNYDLSNARAQAVKRYLVSRGLDPATIQTAGMGPDRPVAGNATRDGKSQNRRVEIYVLVRQGAGNPGSL